MATKRGTSNAVVPAGDNLFDSLMDQADFFDPGELLEEGAFIADKNELVGVPFIVLDWTHMEGNAGDMVRVNVVLQNGERASFADFSQGVRLQLEDITRKFEGMEKNEAIKPGTTTLPRKPIYFPFGLRVSSYSKHDDLTGKDIPASTFYLDPRQR